MTELEIARADIDEAIDKWLKLNGLTEQQIGELDYSFIDNELNDLARG